MRPIENGKLTMSILQVFAAVIQTCVNCLLKFFIQMYEGYCNLSLFVVILYLLNCVGR